MVPMRGVVRRWLREQRRGYDENRRQTAPTAAAAGGRPTRGVMVGMWVGMCVLSVMVLMLRALGVAARLPLGLGAAGPRKALRQLNAHIGGGRRRHPSAATASAV